LVQILPFLFFYVGLGWQKLASAKVITMIWTMSHAVVCNPSCSYNNTIQYPTFCQQVESLSYDEKVSGSNPLLLNKRGLIIQILPFLFGKSWLPRKSFIPNIGYSAFSHTPQQRNTIQTHCFCVLLICMFYLLVTVLITQNAFCFSLSLIVLTLPSVQSFFLPPTPIQTPP
jgi:hypothetical protein